MDALGNGQRVTGQAKVGSQGTNFHDPGHPLPLLHLLVAIAILLPWRHQGCLCMSFLVIALAIVLFFSAVISYLIALAGFPFFFGIL